jgi:hypothetical protein
MLSTEFNARPRGDTFHAAAIQTAGKARRVSVLV